MKQQQPQRERSRPQTASPSRVRASVSRQSRRRLVIRGVPRRRFSVNVASVSDQVVAGLNAMTTTLAYVNAMTMTDLPTLTEAPPWWTSFTTNWTNAQTNALEWVNSIGPDFTAIPQSFINYNQIFQTNVQTIEAACAALEQNGSDPTAKSQLQTALNALLTTVEGEQSLATQFATEINTFAGNLNTDSANLITAVQDALQTEGADQQQIVSLQSQIASLQTQIASYNQALTAGAVAIPLSVFVMGVGIAVALTTTGPAGLILYVVGVIGLLASIVTVVVENDNIKQAQAGIASDSAQMSALNQQIAGLNALSQMLTSLIALANSAQAAVQAIITAWSEVGSDLQEVLTELNAAGSDESSGNWAELATDAGEALTDWNALQSLVQGFANVTFNVSSSIVPIAQAN